MYVSLGIETSDLWNPLKTKFLEMCIWGIKSFLRIVLNGVGFMCLSHPCCICPPESIHLDIITTTGSEKLRCRPSLLLTFYVNKRQTNWQNASPAVPSVSTEGGGGMRVGVVIKPQRRSCFGQYPKRANTSCKIRDTPMMECGGIL
jgi:hypothetical protein